MNARRCPGRGSSRCAGRRRGFASSLEPWLESTASGAGAPEYAVIGLAAAALARAALQQNEAAATLLAEILATPGAREIQYYGIYMPMMVRTALEFGDRALAERLADGCESNTIPSPPTPEWRSVPPLPRQ